MQWSLQNFVHGTTAVLSWHMQKFVAVWSPATELQLGEVSIEFELWAKKSLVKRAPGMDNYITWSIKCGMKLIIHNQASTVQISARSECRVINWQRCQHHTHVYMYIYSIYLRVKHYKLSLVQKMAGRPVNTKPVYTSMLSYCQFDS